MPTLDQMTVDIDSIQSDDPIFSIIKECRSENLDNKSKDNENPNKTPSDDTESEFSYRIQLRVCYHQLFFCKMNQLATQDDVI